MKSGQLDNIEGRQWEEVRMLLTEVSQSRAKQGSSTTETAMFILSVKQPLFACLRAELAKDTETLAEYTWIISSLLDKLGLLTMEIYQRSRDQIIVRQQQELLEFSTL
jgi:rsbT co-antagonist protein RsbR